MNTSKALLMTFVLHAALAMSSAQGLPLLTPTNTTWRYFTNGTDPGTGWALPGFDDSSWPQGVGLFGNDGNVYAPLAFNTPVPGPFVGSGITTYFRTRFNWNGSPLGVILGGTNYVDDGCVVYLNGVEITRINMPPGPPAFDTLAPAANPGGFPNVNAGEPVLVQMQIPLGSLTNGNANPLVNGDNILAVEVHQNSPTSSDVVFGMSLFASGCSAPCSDGIQPNNRVVLEGRSTTFIVGLSNCIFPTPAYQWYRDVGLGEELIPGATASSYTLTNAQDNIDDGLYYCRLTTFCGTVDSRRAVLDIQHDDQYPQFIVAYPWGQTLNKFRLITDEPLCSNSLACGSDYTFQFNWQINQSDNTSLDLGVASIVQINATTYEFTTSSPRDPTKRYQITVTPVFGEISDLFGYRVPPGTYAEAPVALTFQQGDANGYAGTQDASIHSGTPDTPAGTDAVINVDGDDGGSRQGLLRFDGIFGNGLTQIPPGALIRFAILTLNQTDNGNVVNLHRMLRAWDQNTATWNLLGDGLSADGTEAATVIDAVTPGLDGVVGPIHIDVTATLRAWANGAPNFGWAMLPTGGDGWRWNTSESGASTAPMLTLGFAGYCDCGPPAISHQPPPAVSLEEFSALTIDVGVSNILNDTQYQWTKDGADIPGANSSTLDIIPARPGDSGTYRIRIFNPRGSVTSSPCVVTVIPDTHRPVVTRVSGAANGTNVTVIFNESISVTSALNLANYELTPAGAVTSAVLGPNNTVILTTAARDVGTSYSLRVANITDTAATPNSMNPNPTIVNLTTARIVAGAAWADNWRYNTNNLDASPGWKNPDFTPGTDWGIGPGLFGLEISSSVLAAAPAPIVTPLTPNSTAPGDQLTTTYFRKVIDLPPLPAGARYVVCHYTDDGFIAYLDGAEIHRYAMPAGAVTFTNRSTGIPNGEASYRSFSFNATPGPHTLAAELHQAGTTSSDVLFGMEVRLVDDASPALSIAPSINGGVGLSWNADDNWRLRRAAALTGPYLDVAVPVGTRFGTYLLPSSSATNGTAFFRLDYIGRP